MKAEAKNFIGMIRRANKNDKAIFEILPHAVSAFKKNLIDPFFGENKYEKYVNESPPLRAELFTEEQLKQHARAISKKHQLIVGPPTEQLLKRLAENESILIEVHTILTETVSIKERIVPAAEWLLDNFYLIEEQIHIGKKHLPKGYSKGLPRLARGESAGLPRVYDIAVEIISHSDGHIDLNNLTGFIISYQTNTFLKIGELWAFPIMLRLALIENLRRLSIQISIDISNKKLAAEWADKLIGAVENDPKNLVLVIADMARSEPPMDSSFIAELARRLQERGSSLSLALNWIEQQLSDQGLTSDELIQQENQQQAAQQVSISNSISSLRFLGCTEWREFVESTSVVEQILREDPLGLYEKMDFHTRDHYRHSVEKIAKYSNFTEQDVATKAIEMANENVATIMEERFTHVGYHLVGKGLPKLQQLVKVKMPWWEYICNIVSRVPLFIYLGSIFILTALVTWAIMAKANAETFTGWQITLLLLVALPAITQLAINIVNWLSTLLTTPDILPRMDFSKGIPEEYRTMVVIPTILNNLKGIDGLIEGLEIRFLANRDANLCFALLTDFKDAAFERIPEDKILLQAVQHKIIELNKKYLRERNDTFFLFHRPRKWNKKENAWMGYERKRGKLGALNKLVLGKDEQNFSVIIGDRNIYSHVKFIITLDTDTELPRDAAWKLSGTLAHPLNHAVYSEKKRRITEGYGILQPRVSNSLPGDNSSVYAKIHGNEPGTDPYTRAVSDVYQDLFCEGSFIGKGIYDIASFEKVLENKFPENRILSHDLLEGSYARAGLVTDVQLYEDYPTQYPADMMRRHRWIRGDWQIAGWALPIVKGEDRKFYKNPISLLSKWKIFDNLRRSLVPISLLSLFVFGWIISVDAWFWTLTVLLLISFSLIVNLLWEISRVPKEAIFSQHFIYTARTYTDRLKRLFLDLATLPYEGFLNAHAIVITFWRILISRRKLLEWNPYTRQQKQTGVVRFYLKMWIGPAFSLAVFLYLAIYSPATLLFAYPLLALWTFAPAITWLISNEQKKQQEELSVDQNLYLRTLARKIWAFFETFVTEEDNWLPPDNYQEEPVERIAHRTSPTNIGMALLSNLAAYDFGYITPVQLIERTTQTINTLQRLEKYRGHLYNWYDTITLQPLAPRYVSTVDSGNLAGHLITLKQGLLALPGKKISGEFVFEGFADAVNIVTEKATSVDTIVLLKNFSQELRENHLRVVYNIADTATYIDEIYAGFTDIINKARFNDASEELWWAKKGLAQLDAARKEISALCPWLSLLPAPAKFTELIPSLPAIPTLKQLARIEVILLKKIIGYESKENSEAENDWLNNFRSIITELGRRAKEIIITVEQLAAKCNELSNIDYDFLYFRSQHLLTIGYNVDEHRKDSGFYDLLASEARLTTFTAIAQGKLPQESWFALGRQLTKIGNTPILLSWSGSMFEYLMPLLVMPTYENTLLNQTYKAIIQKQIEYGKKRGVPWGISESGYNMVDANLNYQYKAFGVPGVGFKRGLGEDLVISPYSTIMALMVNAPEAYDNLQELKQLGFEGKYGFYEAIDYTVSRLQRKQTHTVLRSFMAHHQGMGFLSLAYQLLNQPMQQRFAADIQVKSALLLLQERIPRVTTFYAPDMHGAGSSNAAANDMSMRVIKTAQTVMPEVQLLSNGRYHVMVTNSGGGYSRWKNIAVTRWREDATCDSYGTFCYIRDTGSELFWSGAYQPSLQEGTNYEAVFSQGRAEFRRTDFSLDTHTEIVVSPEDDIELRRVHITNRSRRKRTIEITSYAEVVLVPAVAEEMHPAFSNLFVETDILEDKHAILCTRRARSSEEQPPWMFHLMKVNEAEIKNVSYETDRARFIGRGYTINKPRAMKDATLSGSKGAVLDPVVSMRYTIIIEPHASATIDIIMGIAETKAQCNLLVDKYQDYHLTNRVLELAWTHSQVVLRQINASETDAQLFTRLAGSIIFANEALRTDPSVILKNQRGQSGLWGYSISGDLPIVLLQIEDVENIDLVKKMIQAHAYWRMKGIMVDLVIWNEDHGGYRQVLQNQILSLLAPGIAADVKDLPGGIFIRSSDQISNEDRVLFQTVARVVISDRMGSLEEQISRRSKLKVAIPYFSPTKFHPTNFTSIPIPNDLQFFNEMGGFSPDGKEYVIITTAENSTPAPWSNVLANPAFGSIITESGQSYTWIDNAHEIRLTPWNNDPIIDLKGEAFYIRDEESGKFWSPAALPCRGASHYITRHGFGYSIFEHSEDGIVSSMTVYADIEAPIKFIVIKFHNNSRRARRLTVTGYIEWVLGDLKSKTQMHVITEMDIRSGAILARNSYNTEFGSRVAFFDADDSNKTITTDRAEFIGRNGTLSNPEGLNKARLSGRTGAALDPCAAIQISVDLAEDQEKQIIFRLGAGQSMQDAVALIKRFEGSSAAEQSLNRVQEFWKETLSAVQVETPDAAVNILCNGWLTYQTIASRIWARSGFYQSGGAFGFRDQLQDTLSLMHTRPTMVKEQILLCASRQFTEGDVQHWWHPPVGRGVRTTCSDDYLWLPFVTAGYVTTTGDNAILDEVVPFLEGRLLNAGEESYYDLPIISDKKASLYEHCTIAIDHALSFGEHGLPFIGSGDWNDGMDKVGNHGKGESTWLGFFLYEVLMRFIKIAALKNDLANINKYKDTAANLQINLNKNAWDGDWFLRAYFDDGSLLGSKKSEECKIDSIAQSWSVLSGAGELSKQKMAMNSTEKYLVKKEDGIIQLFDPPFNNSDMNPGYIKGYVPGVRENGGQYTHAAIWLVMAFAKLGDQKKTWELLQLINPLNHGKDAASIRKYKTEPYVIAADVYSEPLHKGMGGWTWYTGSAGWMYQLLTASFIGLNRQADKLYFFPCLPEEWDAVKVQYRYLNTIYKIEVKQLKNESGTKIIMNGKEESSDFILLTDDGLEHEVVIMVGILTNQNYPENILPSIV